MCAACCPMQRSSRCRPRRIRTSWSRRSRIGRAAIAPNRSPSCSRRSRSVRAGSSAIDGRPAPRGNQRRCCRRRREHDAPVVDSPRRSGLGAKRSNGPRSCRHGSSPASRRPSFASTPTGGLVGLGLLLADLYHPSAVLLSACVTGGTTAFIAAERFGHRNALHWPALVAVGLALGFLGLAAGFHSEHVLTTDPGIYVKAGRSIPRTHELHPIVRTGAFRSRGLSMQAASINESKHGRLKPNFFPFLPVVLALGWSIGGDSGLLYVPAVLGTLGVLCCYALAPESSDRVALFRAALPRNRADATVVRARRILRTPGAGLGIGRSVVVSRSASRPGCGHRRSRGNPHRSVGTRGIDAYLSRWVSWSSPASSGFVATATPMCVERAAVVVSFGASFGATLTCALATASHIAHDYIKALQGEFHEVCWACTRCWRSSSYSSSFIASSTFVQRVARNRTLFAKLCSRGGSIFAWCYWWRPKPRTCCRWPRYHGRVRSVGRSTIGTGATCFTGFRVIGDSSCSSQSSSALGCLRCERAAETGRPWPSVSSSCPSRCCTSYVRALLPTSLGR